MARDTRPLVTHWEWYKNGQGLLVRRVVTEEEQEARQRATEEARARQEHFLDEQVRIADELERRRLERQVAVSLRIGVFFDGTGNNTANAEEGAACRRSRSMPEDQARAIVDRCEPYKLTGSYANDVTNVWRLYDLYPTSRALQGEGQKRWASLSIYVQGIGTVAGQPDQVFSSATGRGETGIATRVYDAFKAIRSDIKQLLQQNADFQIESITFDVFGFSRGAVVARHFAHQLLFVKDWPVYELLSGLGRHLESRFVHRFGEGIRAGVLGLFDSVAATAGWTDWSVRNPVEPGLQITLPQSRFPHVVHLVAADEQRANFPLSSLAPDHLEIALPGVHSDIGGGYLAEDQERVLVGPMRAQTVPLQTPIEETAIYVEAQEDLARQIAQGWPADALSVHTPPAESLPADPQDRLAPRLKRVFAGVELSRPLSGKLSLVYLRLMHKLVTERGVPLDVIDIHDPKYEIPDELAPLCERFLAGDYQVTDAEYRMLRRRYIHCSAHWTPILNGHYNRLLYVNTPTNDGIRVIHPHKPQGRP
ncbi:hypothetical protein BZL41_17815 [Pseudomonas sp. PIC25]|uniref:T6SS phospholipase effector Tle1-like catalytic domain-containing protein n=1 Tax=Pseudomonas sp. PIC25 TaxID=1958773 RepID=UPI000BAC0D7A|nr:DUF2235 domain-containing protein [Pseudomonas sp. PIC25]PAU58377.1 hypothetical protein BZL41_17815 [Pseudomonas sp. PIC25]